MPGLPQLGRVSDEPLEPGELVVELRSRVRIAVRQIQRRHQYAADGGLHVASLRVGRVARQRAADWHGVGAARQQCDAVSRSLTHHQAAIAGALEFRAGVPVCGGLELLERHHVWFRRAKPGQQERQAPVDVVDVPGGNLHGRRIAAEDGARFTCCRRVITFFPLFPKFPPIAEKVGKV